MKKEIHAVTGVYGYSGKYIAKELLQKGCHVITLTNSLNRPNPFGDAVKAFPLDFYNPDKLAKSLEGAKVLYNTYWVRFNHKTFTFAQAVENTRRLFHAAKMAGVQRIVHVSVANPSDDSPLEYYHGKAQVEKMLIEAGLSYAILRPAIIFGGQDILINNIAWMLRRFPVFGVFGDGSYKLQPIHVQDLAELCVRQGDSSQNSIINAIGPETFTFKEMVLTITKILGIKRLVIPAPAFVGLVFSKIIGLCVGDVMITPDEMKAMMSDLLCVDSPPAGGTKLSDWILQNKDTLGRHYAGELSRRQDRNKAYK
jgi:nucleoside-diphosphate-sugar epimerase